MSDVYVIGVSCTAFGMRPEASFKDLAREAYESVLRDAGLDDGGPIEPSWFGNCGMGSFGQPGIRGQVCPTPRVREGRFPERVPMVNVEGGCATAPIGDDIDLAEVHDATSFCEIDQSEMPGLCEDGAGGAYVASGASALDGVIGFDEAACSVIVLQAPSRGLCVGGV